MKKLIVLFLLLVAVCAQAQGPEHVQIGGRDVAIWKPAGQAPESGFPVVVFSHGFGGCNTQSVFLMEALAQDGYLVLAPNHKDARCGTARDGNWMPPRRRPQSPFRDPEQWNDTTYKDRAADIETLLDTALREKTFAGVVVDGSRIGIAGHSLGGYTALGLAGGWPSWKDKRIKAVLALSPHCSPFLAKGDLGQMNVPVMYQGGTRDLGETRVVRRPEGAYDKTSAPKYYVEFEAAGHFAWTNLLKLHQEPINTYSLAFFDRYLKGQSDRLAELMAQPPKIVSEAKAEVGRGK